MTKISEISGESTNTVIEENEEKRIRKFAKTMLKNSLFVGIFQEKRLVSPINAYRDVVKIDETEDQLIQNVKIVKKRLIEYYKKDKWIGITDSKTIGAPAGCNLWVTLNEEVFGQYCYKIKSIDFLNNEICLRLETVRPFALNSGSTCEKAQNLLNGSISMQDIVQNVETSLKNQFNFIMTNVLTASNIKDTAVFLFVLLSTLATFLVHTLKYLLEYFLRLMHECSGFINASTPIFQSVLNVITNTINGFYYLIAFIWKTRHAPPKPTNNLYIMPRNEKTYPYYDSYKENQRSLRM